MSAVIEAGPADSSAAEAGPANRRAASPVPAGAPGRIVAFDGSRAISLAAFLAHVHGVAAQLPDGPFAVNLCEDRYRFLVALCAAALRGQATLLPSSRAPAAVGEVLAAHPGAWCIGEAGVAPRPPRFHPLPAQLPEAEGGTFAPDDDAVAVIGFTSGSTGRPQPNPKTWGSFRVSTAQNLAALGDLWATGLAPAIVATVPPQHMYGMELSVLVPLLADASVHAGRPLFPADVARALHEAPGPRVLVTTPVHLRALVASGTALPPMAGVVSATAPLAPALAAEAEARFGCEVRELFGSTETCIFARRRTARDTAWTPLPGVRLQPRPDGAVVAAPHLAAPVALSDLVEVDAQGRFELRGRHADLLEIAGKRASLADLTRRLLDIPGVEDGVVFQLDGESGDGVRRIAALAVAPGRDAAGILAALREAVDPVFLPRPLRLVDALPRNETGKLPRAALVRLLA